MLKKGVILILVILVFSTCALIYINVIAKELNENNNFQDFSNIGDTSFNMDKNLTENNDSQSFLNKFENIEDFKNNFENIVLNTENSKDFEYIMKVGEESITKGDLEEIKLINQFKENATNPIIDVVRQAVAIQEAKRLDIKISDASISAYEKVAEGMYKTDNEGLSKQEYMDKWMRIQENEELARLFMAKIMMQMSANEKVCDDETVNEKIVIFHSEKTPESLKEAYNSFLDYLLLNYEIWY